MRADHELDDRRHMLETDTRYPSPCADTCSQKARRRLKCVPPPRRPPAPASSVKLTPEGFLQLLADTGASVVTKGTWLPDKSKATAADPPLYLHVVAQTKEILDKALAAVRSCSCHQRAIDDRADRPACFSIAARRSKC